jgi:hypothetical protein
MDFDGFCINIYPYIWVVNSSLIIWDEHSGAGKLKADIGS